MANLVKTAKKTKKRLTKMAFSKTVLSTALFLIAIGVTVVYSLWGVSWDPKNIDWGRFAWNMSLVVGLFLVALFCGWTMEQQNVLGDEESELAIARTDYKASREKIRPKDQYFGQYYLWEKARQINAMKADALTQIGWRSANGGTYAGEVLNATAQDIAFHASESDIRRAEEVNPTDAVLVDRDGYKFYIAHITHEMAEATIEILTRKEDLEFCSADYYLIGSSYDADDQSPRFAKGKRIAKKNNKKAIASIVGSVLLITCWSILVAGAVVDEFYGNSSNTYFNLISRILALLSGFLRGIGISDNYYDGIALLLRDKIEVLENFYNCVMVDGNFKPDTMTQTAEGIFLKAREEERKKAEALRLENEKKPDEPSPDESKDKPEEEKKTYIDERIDVKDLM